jgi:hypothetical protein
MTASVTLRPVSERALEAFRRAGNPFRNYFARNPDDDVCRRYHVPQLYARERQQLLAVVDLYRYGATTHSDVIPILGNKGAGKTHLLYSIKHGQEDAWQLLVTPGTFQRDTDFLEYLLFQIIDTLLGGSKQRGTRPLHMIGQPLTRRLLHDALAPLPAADRPKLVGGAGLARLARRLGWGAGAEGERFNGLLAELADRPGSDPARRHPVNRLCADAGLGLEDAMKVIMDQTERTGSRDTLGQMRRRFDQGLARAVLTGDESDLAGFLTHGFADMPYQVRPGRQELVLSLFKVLSQCLLELHAPIVVAFDQLEDLLLARRADDGRKNAEAFFAGMVQVMHQVDGICFLVFAERGLWNRFVPSLDGYIQDRLNNPIHVPEHGTIKTVRLEPPSHELVRRIVEARLQPTRAELPDAGELPSLFPFNEEQVQRVAKAEPTLRDMLQQFRQMFDRLVYEAAPPMLTETTLAARLSMPELPAAVKSVVVLESPAADETGPGPQAHDPSSEEQSAQSRIAADVDAIKPVENAQRPTVAELWDQEMQAAKAQLEPDGALLGATRELQAGLAKFMQFCHHQGLKAGPWRLTHIVEEMTFSDHPTYGALTLAHWVCKNSQPWKVGIGLFLARGAGKPRDLEIKLGALEIEPRLLDYLILLRPDDDLAISGKSKTLWQEAEGRGRHARIEPLDLAGFASLYAFPRWLAAVHDAQSSNEAAPALADFVQDRCQRLLEQLCMPIQE